MVWFFTYGSLLMVLYLWYGEIEWTFQISTHLSWHVDNTNKLTTVAYIKYIHTNAQKLTAWLWRNKINLYLHEGKDSGYLRELFYHSQRYFTIIKGIRVTSFYSLS